MILLCKKMPGYYIRGEAGVSQKMIKGDWGGGTVNRLEFGGLPREGHFIR